MSVSGQTVTQTSDGVLQGAEIGPFAFPPVGESRVFELHYDPATWAGGDFNNDFAIGNLVAGITEKVDAEGAMGQANTVLVCCAINHPTEGKILAIYEEDGSIGAQGVPSATTLTEFYGQVIATKLGAAVTFVTNQAQFQSFHLTPLATDPDVTAHYDVEGNLIV